MEIVFFFWVILYVIIGYSIIIMKLEKKICEYMIKIERKLLLLINELIENYF